MKSFFFFPIVIHSFALVVGCAAFNKKPSAQQEWLDEQEQLESDNIRLDRVP
jgi:hypothetical protein